MDLVKLQRVRGHTEKSYFIIYLEVESGKAFSKEYLYLEILLYIRYFCIKILQYAILTFLYVMDLLLCVVWKKAARCKPLK